MSYILDALKKNKTNSDKDSVPDLSSEHGASGYDYSELEEENALSRWLWPVLVMVLLLVVAILVFMLLNPSAQQVSEDIVKQPITVNSQISASAETKQESTKQDGTLIADDTVITNKPLEVGEPVVSKKERSTLKKQSSVTKQAKQKVSKASSKITKADLPQLVYTTHIYATQSKDRFVMLNGRAYAEGDKTVEGIIIKEILENDLVIIFKGQEFILPSLEDVNPN